MYISTTIINVVAIYVYSMYYVEMTKQINKKKRFNYYLDVETIEKLKAIAGLVPLSRLVEVSILEYVERNKELFTN